VGDSKGGGWSKRDDIALAPPIYNNQLDGDRTKRRGGWE
jgi:hypothetical protein